ncbi:biotin-dependent carboxyltransferase family protein [Agromyces seonyuensis]|uniref:5-oxoprolinase subunit C family protein n=1 Tax=Agromyces seonyuensis TaxID=2662446 RepID=UPI003014A2CE
MSGAADRGALREANRLVGNVPGTAALEAAGGGAVLRAHGELLVAVTGAEGPVIIEGRRGDALAPRGRAFVLLPDERLVLGEPERGIRTVIAVRGGLDVPGILGSASTDTLAGLGPAALAPGDRLAVAPARRGAVGAPGPLPRPPASGATTLLDVVLGPRDDWFDEASLARFADAEWVVTPRSDRVGARLDGPALARAPRFEGVELPSEGLVPGALQVPPDGRPILFGRDHPVTGGYPVIAVVAAVDLDLALQLPPGARVRFRPRPPTPA